MASAQRKAPLFLLVPPTRKPADPETVNYCRSLLEQAMAGDVVGLAIVAQTSDKHFFVDTIGGARRDPVLMRGMVCSLDDDLAEMIASEKDA